jgi:hypothetical protein
VPIIEYNSEVKINLKDELLKSNYILHFKKWQRIWCANVTGNTLNIVITNIYRNVYNPVWVYFVFQKKSI